MKDRKVAILPCNGVGRLVSTVARQAGYLVVKEMPEETVLVSSPALAVDVEEELAKVRTYPVIVIDGCKPKCGSNILATKSIEAATAIYAPYVAAERRISIAGDSRRGLSERGMKLVRAIADIVEEKVAEILKRKPVEAAPGETTEKERDESEEILSRL